MPEADTNGRPPQRQIGGFAPPARKMFLLSLGLNQIGDILGSSVYSCLVAWFRMFIRPWFRSVVHAQRARMVHTAVEPTTPNGGDVKRLKASSPHHAVQNQCIDRKLCKMVQPGEAGILFDYAEGGRVFQKEGTDHSNHFHEIATR